MMKKILYIVMALTLVFADFTGASAQEYRRANRRGNKAFAEGDYEGAVMHYDKALSKDTVNTAHLRYNKAYVLHSDRRDSTRNMLKDSLALEQLDMIAEAVVGTEYEYDYHFNRGVIAIDMKDWQSAVDEFKKCLIMDPGDMKARENYIYAKEHLKNQQQQQQQQQQQNQDQHQNQDQNQQNDQNQDQKNDQNDQQGDQNDQQGDQDQQQGDQDQQDQQGQPRESKISPQAAKQILQAMQAKEKETQDKVEKKKAAAMKSKQKEKNW